MTQEQQKDPFFAPYVEGSDFTRLDDGVYNAVCVGATIRPMPNFNNPEKLDDKVQYIFQVNEGEVKYYFRTAPMTIVIKENSNLFKFIANWTGATLDRVTAGFQVLSMLGFGAQVVVNTITGKNGKQYSNLANVLKLKKGVKVTPVADEIPAYLVRNATYVNLVQGLTVKAEEPPVQAQPAQPAATAQSQFMPPKPPTTPVSFAEFQANAARTPDEIPVAPFPAQPGPAQSAPSPYVAPQPKQAPADPDSDLPF